MLEEKTRSQVDLDKVVTITIPTLNEEVGISKVLEELHSLDLKNILVIDGYSSDGTVEVARQLGARVVYQHGKGKTGAIKTAIEHIDTPYILVMDGDFTYDASYISRILQHAVSYDEVIGARRSIGNSMSRLHRFGNRMISKVFNILLNTNLSDVCSGMYLLKTASAREINLTTTGFDVEAEIAAQIAMTGTITEVPINYRQRLGRQKLSTWKHGFRIISSIFGLARTYNPAVFYSMFGSLTIIPAALIFFNSFIEWIFTGQMINQWFFVGISMLLVAIQAMSVGVMSLVLRRSELRVARMLRKVLVSA